MHRPIITALTLATVAACASPNPPTVSASDVNRAFAEANAIRGLPFMATEDLPTGSVNYRGKLGADVAGDLSGSILGDLSMDVAFTGNDVSGKVTNINLIDTDGRPDQRLDGSLGIDGFESAGRIDAFASGELTGVDDGGLLQDSDVLLVLDGDVFDDGSRNGAVFGSASGTGTGDLELTIDGVFFGRSD